MGYFMVISVAEASTITGWSTGYIRSACKRGVIGDGYSGGSGARMTCVVSPGRLAAFMGIEVKELEDAVSNLRYKKFREGLHNPEEQN